MLLSVIILTKNEAVNLPTCLASLQPLNAEIYIVDSGSSDQTVDLAKQAGCKVFSHSWENHAKQVNWALENLPITTPWIIRMDADEYLTPELVEELKQVLPNTPSEVTGYQVKRRVYFMGRWIRHGGYYPTWLLRVWRKGFGVCEDRWIDEHIMLTEGRIGSFKHDIVDDNKKGLSFWTEKHNSYSDCYLKEYTNPNYFEAEKILEDKNAGQARQRRLIQRGLYDKMPLFLRSFIYFSLRYFIGLGFLDGLHGLVFHFLQGFWYRFLIDAKIYEYNLRQSSKALSKELISQNLSN
ncbi:MAG: glycosyltransferase family 2 protein [Stigonema ocellatum SAG 48.90 = DSM 106950]|nr:glycosyltransferase family 2 protein [Stigonema ocellatum SAG 48.90 = DSM 106950]